METVKVPAWILGPLVIAVFAVGIYTARELGVWKGRERALPEAEQFAPAPAAPTPGGLPM